MAAIVNVTFKDELLGFYYNLKCKTSALHLLIGEIKHNEQLSTQYVGHCATHHITCKGQGKMYLLGSLKSCCFYLSFRG